MTIGGEGQTYLVYYSCCTSPPPCHGQTISNEHSLRSLPHSCHPLKAIPLKHVVYLSLTTTAPLICDHHKIVKGLHQKDLYFISWGGHIYGDRIIHL